MESALVLSALRRLRQEDQRLKGILSYVIRSCRRTEKREGEGGRKREEVQDSVRLSNCPRSPIWEVGSWDLNRSP